MVTTTKIGMANLAYTMTLLIWLEHRPAAAANAVKSTQNPSTNRFFEMSDCFAEAVRKLL